MGQCVATTADLLRGWRTRPTASASWPSGGWPSGGRGRRTADGLARRPQGAGPGPLARPLGAGRHRRRAPGSGRSSSACWRPRRQRPAPGAPPARHAAGGAGRPRRVRRLKDADALRFQAATALGRIGDPAPCRACEPRWPSPTPLPASPPSRQCIRIGRAGPPPGKPSPRAWPATGRRYAKVPCLPCAKLTRCRWWWPWRRRGSPSLLPETRAAALAVLAQLYRQPPAWKGEWWAYHPVNLPRPARTVAWAGTDGVRAALRGGLADRQPLVRRASIDGLRETGDASTAPRLRETVSPGDGYRGAPERLAGPGCLQGHRGRGAGGRLPRRSPILADAAARSCGDRRADRQPRRPGSLPAPGPKEPETRLAVIRPLGQLRAAESFALLVEQLQQGDRPVRVAAVEALGRLGGERRPMPSCRSWAIATWRYADRPSSLWAR